MKNIKYILILIALVFISSNIYAQTGGPGPASGVPIDGLSGILLMAAAAIFGKKIMDKKE
ncbi:MAG: hypothetical protein ACI8V8_002212 [Chitinophagales bacterium]|jgi:hypothetical protein